MATDFCTEILENGLMLKFRTGVASLNVCQSSCPGNFLNYLISLAYLPIILPIDVTSRACVYLQLVFVTYAGDFLEILEEYLYRIRFCLSLILFFLSFLKATFQTIFFVWYPGVMISSL